MKVHKGRRFRWGKAVLSYLLIISMVLGLIPQSAYAAGVETASANETYEDEGFTITYEEGTAWGEYVNVNITLQNNTDHAKSLWKLTFDYEGQIDSIWNADIVSSEKNKYVVAAKNYNSTIGAGQSVSFGFIAHGTDKKVSAPKKIQFVKGSGSEGSSEGSTEEGGSTETGGESGDDDVPEQGYVIPEKWKGLKYALFTSGDSDIALYTGQTNITGSVHTNQNFYYQGSSLKVDGTLEAAKGITIKTSDNKDSLKVTSKKENAEKIDMPDITKEVSDYAKEHGTVYDSSKEFGTDPIVIEDPIYADGDITFHSTGFLGQGIVYAKGSVTMNVGAAATPDDSRVFVAAQEGNITLNGSNLSLNAVLYAPNGCVYINANEMHLNGRIIAKQVCINGTKININAGPYDLDMLDFLFKPEIDLDITGNQKENRKLVLDVREILNTEYIVKEDTLWNITEDGADASANYAIDEEVSDAFHKEILFRKAGTYTVSVTVTTGKVNYTVTKELVIAPDISPEASFELQSGYYGRNEEGKATITLKDLSVSPDGDHIGQRIWTIYYDSDNNGEFSEAEATVISDGNETELTYETENVGKYRVLLQVKEIFEDTIPKLITDDVFLRDTTAEFSDADCVFEVGNEAPVADLKIEKSKSADIVFTLGDTGKDNINVYNAKAEELKTILANNGIDAKVDAISTSIYTAQDTFAWKEYSHYNCDGYENHIIYDEDSIQMVGYQSSPKKDFLYIANDNPGQKIFEFDLQRDRTDWHSMEGGGFLFNTTVSEEDNTIKGFCILVTRGGLYLIQLDCNNLKEFRDGGYGWTQYAGKLLKIYPISNVYAEHHIKIMVDSETISVWDGENLMIDNYVLPENDYGYGFGPFTSQVSHDCGQRSYFTFKNITMQTMAGSSLSDLLAGYEWRPGASHYVVNLSEESVPELSSDESMADLAASLIRNKAAFVGIGNETNENQYLGLLNVTNTGGYFLSTEDISGKMDEINNYILQSVLAKDYTIGDSITTDDIVAYEGIYQDAENDPIYEQHWEYEYDPSVFTSSTGEAEHIVRDGTEPIRVFENTGAYSIRLAVRDNPAGENDALDEYRLWSDTKQYEKLLVVQSRPIATVDAEVMATEDKAQCIANVTYEAHDPDHMEDGTKGIREEYFWYRDMADSDWVEGKLPNKLLIGHTYLVKYQVKDIEGTLSFPAVCVVKTGDLRQYEEVDDDTPPTVYIDTAKTEIKVGEELYIEGYALDDYGVDSFEMYVGKEKVLDCFGRILYKPAKAGTVTIKAVAIDIGGNRSEKELEIQVVDNGDTTAPIAEITSPTEGSELGFQIQIKGTATDETKLAGYTLSYREQKEKEYHIFKESTEEVKDDILGTLDISEFKDGTYEILLTVEDQAGNISHYGIVIFIQTGVTIGYRISGEIKDVTLSDDESEIHITGSVSGEGHMKKYTLSYRVDDSEEPVLIAEGTEELTDKVLGIIKTEDMRSGTYHLILTVEDTEGNSVTASGSFEYTEGESLEADLNPPVAEITGVKLTEDKNNIDIKASVSDDKELEGYSLSYGLDGSEEFVELAKGTKKLEDEYIASIPTTELADGTYVLRLEARDSFGNSCTYTMKFTYTKGNDSIDTGNGNGEEGTVPTEPVKREFAVNLSYSAAPIGTEVKVQVTLPDDMAEENLVILQDGKELVTGTRKTTFTSEKSGKVTITAKGTDGEGKEKTVTAQCTFFNDKDKTAPTAEISSPTIDQILTEPVDIKGSAFDDLALDFWKLEYRMKGETDYLLLAQGTEAKKDEVLAHFDTTMLMNGQYEVRLFVQDQGGNITKLENDYVVEGELKVGAMHIGFTDITAPMGGTTVSVNRIYDSRNKSRGDFGVGWTLGLSGMKLYENHAITDGYEMVKSGSLFSTGYQMTETENHDVTITYGDGTSDRFTLTFTPERQALVPISEVKLGYRCVTNQKVKLEIVGDTSAYISGGELLFHDESMYDDLKYKLTTEDGNVIYLNQKGAYKITDTSGNVIKIDKDGYHSEDGKSIAFTRDKENRITKACDPNGNETIYTYDGNGDLTSVTDSADRTVTFTYDKKHNLISITDPMGIAVARNEYDDDGRLIATIDADGNRMEYDYDVEGRRETVKDRNGNTTIYIYDDNGNVLQTMDAYGHKTTNTYDANNNLLSTKDANGNTTSYSYDSSGNVTSVTAADGTRVDSTYTQDNCVSSIQMLDKTIMAMEYDSNGRLSSVEDANGNTTSYEYTSDGKITGMTDAIGQVQQVTYDKSGNVAATTNGAGERAAYTYDKDGRCTGVTISREENGETLTFTSHYSYNAAGDMVESIDNAGNVTSYEYDQNGNQTASVDAKGNRITYAYDDLANLTKTTYPDGTFETFAYDANGNNISATDRSGLKITMKYDKLDRMTEKTYADGSKESYVYDAVGNVTETVSATGAKTTYTYDSRNRNTSITDALGNVTSFEYDEQARLTARKDVAGNITSYDYDANGNIIKTTYPDGTAVTSKYDARNRVVSQKNQYGYETRYSYDGADRLTTVTDAYGNRYTYGYDSNGNLVTVTDAKEQVTAYTYDAAGRVSTVRNALGKTMAYSYDEIGNITEYKDYAGIVTTYAYDDMNQLVKKTVGSESTIYTYSDTGLLTKVKDSSGTVTYGYDNYDRLISKTDARGVKLTYTYDKVGRLSAFDNGFGTTKYEYDVLDRITRVIDRNGQATVYEYDALGNRSAVRYPNGNVMTYTYDACQRLKEENIVNGNGVQLAKYSYGIGKAGERISVTEINSGVETEITYKYDKLNRLVKETIECKGNRLTNEYEYDEVSNRTKKKTTVKGDITSIADTSLDEVEVTEGTTTYTYNSLNQLITEVTDHAIKTYTYDANGNLIKQTGERTVDYSYDKEMHLIKATIQKGNSVTIESYTYDYAGNRTSKTINESDVKYYVNDTSGSLSMVVAETDKAGKEQASFTRGDNAEFLSMERGQDKWYYLSDGHGSVRILTNIAGRITDRYGYDAYGNLLEKEGDADNDFLYTGEQYNANTGLYYLRARYMNPSTGTFISMDSYQGSIYDPVTLHKYLYANANPVMYTDPSGYTSLSELSITTCIQNTINSVHQIRSLTKIIKWANTMCTVYDTAMEIRSVILGDGSMLDVVGALLKGVVIGFMVDGMCKTSLGIILKPIMAIFGLGSQVDQIQEAIKSGDPVEISVRFLQLICMLFGLTSQCFTGDTLVSTEYGLLPIEEIQAGDYVWSENTETGEKELKKVLSVSVAETKVLVHVYTENGTEIDTTENHPFYVEGKGWCAAAELEAGDVLRTQDGNVEIVSAVEIVQLDETVKVYNLEIEDSHTYYVSAEGVLVHNDCDGAEIIELDPKEINFSQETINPMFDTPDGKVAIEKLKRQGPKQVENFPPIRVMKIKGQYVVRDGNSRLYLARKTKARKIKVIIETSHEALQDLLSRLRRNGYGIQGSPDVPTH